MRSPEVEKHHIEQLLILMKHQLCISECPLSIVVAQETLHWLEALMKPPMPLVPCWEQYQIDQFIVFWKIAVHDSEIGNINNQEINDIDIVHWEVIFAAEAQGWGGDAADWQFNLTRMQLSHGALQFSHSKIWHCGLLIIRLEPTVSSLFPNLINVPAFIHPPGGET